MDIKKEFKICAVCGEKISRRRRKKAGKLDAKGKFPIIQSQFCSERCAELGFTYKKATIKERQRIREVIDSALKMIENKREAALRRYGSLGNIPPGVQRVLYPGSVKILNKIKEKLKEGNGIKNN